MGRKHSPETKVNTCPLILFMIKAFRIGCGHVCSFISYGVKQGCSLEGEIMSQHWGVEGPAVATVSSDPIWGTKGAVWSKVRWKKEKAICFVLDPRP